MAVSTEVDFERACALHESGKLEDAKAACWEILRRNPKHVETLNRLGMIVGKSGDLSLATQIFRQAIVLDPAHAAATHNRGTAFYNLRNFEAALLHFDRTLSLEPKFAAAHYGRGSVLRESGDFERAAESFKQAIDLGKSDAESWLSLGHVRRELGQHDEALENYSRAIALEGERCEAYRGRALVHLDRQQLSEALVALDRAIELNADCAKTRCNRAFALLLAGDLENGFAELEWRRRDPNSSLNKDAREFATPLWLGKEPLGGRTLFLHCEQGYGDTLQFCRYVPALAERGARIILEAPLPLSSLLARLDGVARVIERGEVIPEHDFHCSLMSLPTALATTLTTIPNRIPYLGCGSERRSNWKALLGRRAGLRVGLTWAGGDWSHHPGFKNFSARRDIPLRTLAPFARSKSEFFSLQKGEPAESELAALVAAGWQGPKIHDFTSRLQGFEDTAAFIEQLDLVISVDTAVAHLAGALGKPVWLLNRFDTCWRWMVMRTDSPWYPSMKIYRQRSFGVWDDVIQTVTDDLLRLTQRG